MKVSTCDETICTNFTIEPEKDTKKLTRKMYEGYSKKFNFFPAIQLNYSYTCVMYKYKHVITNKCSMFNVANCRRYNFIIKSNLRKAYCLLKRITSSFLLKFPQTEQFLKFFPNKNFPLKTICTIFPFLANCS